MEKGFGIKSISLRTLLKTMLTAGVPTISVKQAAQLNDALFIDCREQAEYNVSHLPNAIFVGYDKYTSSPLTTITKSKILIVYCSIGKRSDAITARLINEGYANTRNLVGGIFEWVNQGNAVYCGKEQTTAVHVYSPFWGRWLKKGQEVF